jgi:putative spermidine/putrescine transport system ATP-binding protein
MVREHSLPISIRRLCKRYGQAWALDHVDLEIRSGEFLTLLGPSGSGKTTLLTVLAGFTLPDSGSLKFGEREVIDTPPHKRGVGMVFQNYALFPHMSVAGNVAFPLKLRGVPRDEIAQRVEQALELVRLGGFGPRGVDQLSGGQRQRVALARAMVFEPRIMLMDEPLSALDKQLREHMQIELRQLHDKLGMTTVYVTHDQREALTMSDRIAVISGGRIMQLDEPRQIYERPTCRFVAEFIGDTTFVPVELSQGRVLLQGQPLQLQTPVPAQGDWVLVLRPERLRLVGADAPTGLNLLQVRLQSLVYQGDSVLLQVRLTDDTLTGIRLAPAELAGLSLQPGSLITVGLAASDTVLLPADGSGV